MPLPTSYAAAIAPSDVARLQSAANERRSAPLLSVASPTAVQSICTSYRHR